jgi:hypothetical protein
MSSPKHGPHSKYCQKNMILGCYESNVTAIIHENQVQFYQICRNRLWYIGLWQA